MALQLKVGASRIGGKSEYNGPFPFKLQKWLYTVLTHIRGDGNTIKRISKKEGSGVLLGRVANIATLGIGNGKDVLRNVIEGFLQADPAIYALCFIKGRIYFVRYCEVLCGINNGFIKFKSRIFCV